MDRKKILEAKDLYKSYGKTPVIHGISFHVHAGEIVGFVGPNGAGKTTTLRLLVGLIFPDQGSVSIGGFPLASDRSKALSHVAAIIENPGLSPQLTGNDHLRFIQSVHKAKASRLKEVQELSALDHWLNRPIYQYSLGMKQRLALAMCTLPDPELIILDEPTGGLDPSAVILLRRQIRDLAASGTAVLFSSHTLPEVAQLSDRVLYIKKGKLISHGNFDAQEEEECFAFACSDLQRARAILSASLNRNMLPALRLHEGKIYLRKDSALLQEALQLLSEAGIQIHALEVLTASLEDQYTQIFEV